MKFFAFLILFAQGISLPLSAHESQSSLKCKLYLQEKSFEEKVETPLKKLHEKLLSPTVSLKDWKKYIAFKNDIQSCLAGDRTELEHRLNESAVAKGYQGFLNYYSQAPQKVRKEWFKLVKEIYSPNPQGSWVDQESYQKLHDLMDTKCPVSFKKLCGTPSTTVNCQSHYLLSKHQTLCQKVSVPTQKEPIDCTLVKPHEAFHSFCQTLKLSNPTK
jgi:hypothetical protein